MPLSYQKLQENYHYVLEENRNLKTDPEFGVLARYAIPYEIKGFRIQYVVMLEVDIYTANKTYGAEAVRGKIKRAISVRYSGELLRIHWEGGYRFLFLVDRDPDPIQAKVLSACKGEGLDQVYLAAVTYTKDLESDVRTCEALIQAHKDGYTV